MSVRPITESEKQQSIGFPFTSWWMLLGATQGLLAHLKAHNCTLQGTWFPTPVSRFSFGIFMLVGTGAGLGVGVMMYGDA